VSFQSAAGLWLAALPFCEGVGQWSRRAVDSGSLLPLCGGRSLLRAVGTALQL